MANNTRGGCVRKACKPSSSRPISIYFEFRSKPSLITVICIGSHSPNKLFATKYCFLILGILHCTSFFFFFFPFFLWLFYVIIKFYKNHFIIIIIFFFFHENFFLFLHVPWCSRIFRNVPECSVFRVLTTPSRERVLIKYFRVFHLA